MMSLKYVQNMDSNTTSWTNLDGNSFAVSQIEKEHMINATKKKSFHNTVQSLYSVYIPYDTKEVLELDQENGNDYWKKLLGLKFNNSQIMIPFMIKAY